jgi:hypothetical protein
MLVFYTLIHDIPKGVSTFAMINMYTDDASIRVLDQEHIQRQESIVYDMVQREYVQNFKFCDPTLPLQAPETMVSLPLIVMMKAFYTEEASATHTQAMFRNLKCLMLADISYSQIHRIPEFLAKSSPNLKHFSLKLSTPHDSDLLARFFSSVPQLSSLERLDLLNMTRDTRATRALIHCIWSVKYHSLPWLSFRSADIGNDNE